MMGWDWCRLVTELMMAAIRTTAPAVTRKMADRSCHIPLISDASQETSTRPCRKFPVVIGRPTR